MSSFRIFCFLMQDIKASGGEATAVSLDVSKGRAQIAEGIKKAANAYGQIDILVRVTFSPFYGTSMGGSECPSRGWQIKVAFLQWFVLAFKEPYIDLPNESAFLRWFVLALKGTISGFDGLLDKEIIYSKVIICDSHCRMRGHSLCQLQVIDGRFNGLRASGWL